MSDLDRIGEPSPKSVDKIAEEEERAIISDSRRKTRVSNVKNWCYIVIVSFFTVSIIVLILIRILHLILPSEKDWLNKEQLANINDFFVDGSIGGLVVGFLKSDIIDKDKL